MSYRNPPKNAQFFYTYEFRQQFENLPKKVSLQLDIFF